MSEAPPIYDGKSMMEYAAPGTVAWSRLAWQRIQTLEEAVKAACVLIWEEDVAFVEGGSGLLDQWVADHGWLVDYETGVDE